MVRRWSLLVGSIAAVAWTAPRVPGRWAVVSHPASADLDAVIAAAAFLALAGILAWLALIAIAAVVDVRLARRLGPAWLVGLAIGAGAVLPAHADTSLNGLPLPDRPTATASARPASPSTGSDAGTDRPSGADRSAGTGRSAPTSGATRIVTVRDGDTLWAIAARELPGHPDDRRIATAVRAWARSNADVIGADPDLIRPDQHLTAPKEIR